MALLLSLLTVAVCDCIWLTGWPCLALARSAACLPTDHVASGHLPLPVASPPGISRSWPGFVTQGLQPSMSIEVEAARPSYGTELPLPHSLVKTSHRTSLDSREYDRRSRDLEAWWAGNRHLKGYPRDLDEMVGAHTDEVHVGMVGGLAGAALSKEVTLGLRQSSEGEHSGQHSMTFSTIKVPSSPSAPQMELHEDPFFGQGWENRWKELEGGK